MALRQARARTRGATLYTTLEPCCHTEKRTPPCVPAILDAGIGRVVVAMRDPNPHVAGRGIRQLRRAGVAVDVGCLGSDAAALNEVYLHWINTGQPFVVLKAAMTLDGKIATATGESQWITGAESRAHVHRLRSEVDVIAVGAETVLKDDPQLTVRVSGENGLLPASANRPVWSSTAVCGFRSGRACFKGSSKPRQSSPRRIWPAPEKLNGYERWV